MPFYCKTKLWGVSSKKWRLKKSISHSILKCDLTGVESLFWQKKSEKAKYPKICLSFGVSMPEAQIKRCPLTPSHNLKAKLFVLQD